jgi:hypothetical protein
MHVVSIRRLDMSTAMARPKKLAPKAGPVSRIRDTVTFIRSTEAWKAHVEQLADLDRAPSVSDFIDRAVAHYARSRGFDPPPKR